MGKPQGYYACVEEECDLYRCRVYYQHPAGITVHYSNTFSFFWFAKLVAFIVQEYKVAQLKRITRRRVTNGKYWERYDPTT